MIRVRLCRAKDRGALLAMGHPAGVPPVLAPPLLLRLRWFLAGTLAAGFVAETDRGGAIVGSIHFVRDRRDPGTWMFGHWRVLPAHRRAGIGRTLLREGAARLPGVRRLYSFVDWGNDVSLRAHEHLGFEAAPELQGLSTSAGLASLGPPAPAPRLRPISPRDPEAARLYARSQGDLWMRLVPAVSIPRALGGRVWVVEDGGEAVGLLRLRRGEARLFTLPEACEGALLSRIAARLRDLGVPREAPVALSGLTRTLAAPGGPIVVMTLMGHSHAPRLLEQRGSRGGRHA